MKSSRCARRIALAAGAATPVGIGSSTACESKDKPRVSGG